MQSADGSGSFLIWQLMGVLLKRSGDGEKRLLSSIGADAWLERFFKLENGELQYWKSKVGPLAMTPFCDSPFKAACP